MISEKLEDLTEAMVQNLKKTIDVNMTVGKPINGPDNTILIPVSKVSFGYASGGTENSGEGQSNNSNSSGSSTSTCTGIGGGVTIFPVSFVVIKDGEMKIVPVDTSATITEKVIEQAPQTISKIEKLLKNLSSNKNTSSSSGSSNSQDNSGSSGSS